MSLVFALLASVASDVVNVGERAPLAVVVVTPSGAPGRVSRSEVIRHLADLLARDTDFSPDLLDDGLVKECRGSTSCLVLHAERSPYLLVVSNLTASDGADLMTAFLVDVEQALAARSGISLESPGWQDEADAAIRPAIVARSERAEIATGDEARTFMEAFLRDRARAPLAAAGHWQPFGAIEIVADSAGLAVRLDDVTVATTSTGSTRLVGVAPGTRRITIEHPDYAAFSTNVDVDRGTTAVVRAALERSNGEGSAIRSGVLWSGVVISAAGVFVSVFALAKHDGGTRYCGVAEGSAPCAADRDFRASCYDSRTGTNCGGVLIAPLGLALIGLGATWSLGTLSFGDADAIPWWQIAAGVALGGAIYAISAVAD